MRTRVTSSKVRRVLCVFPAYAPAFGTFSHAFKLVGAKAFMPPQGLLLIANYLPENWPVRFIDENMVRAKPADFAWADVVLVTGMHIQAAQIHDIYDRARAAGKVAALGGPSVSAAPETYPEYEYLHLGELGNATDQLIARLDATIAAPPAQVRFVTKERLPLTDFPFPAYDLVRLDRYLLGTLQFSSGCPYLCEFCDIPNLYGRQPRMKSPQQLIGELDFILSQKAYPASIYFVDDNFIGNRKAAREMLPHLVAWQKRNGYPVSFACEATLNIAKQTEILEMMREARFDAVFVGIETPELEALKAMHKEHNASLPMMEAILEAALMLIVAVPLGFSGFTPDWLSVALVLVVSIAVFLAIGFLGAAFVLAIQQGTGLMSLIVGTMTLAGGSIFPVSVLPSSVHFLTVISPLTYTLRAMRAAMLGGQSPGHLLGGSLGVMLIYAAVTIPLGTIALSASFGFARARGSLSRF